MIERAKEVVPAKVIELAKLIGVEKAPNLAIVIAVPTRRRVRAIGRATGTGHEKIGRAKGIARAMAMIDGVKAIEHAKVTVPARAARRKGAKVPEARAAADSDPDSARRGLVRATSAGAALAEAVSAVDLVGAVAGLAVRILARGAKAAQVPAPKPDRATAIVRLAAKEINRKMNRNGLATAISPAMKLASRKAKTRRSQPA